MDLSLSILRLIHIFSGILWAGWAWAQTIFIEPATQAAGPEGGKFMQTLAAKTRLIPAMLVAPLLVILTGILLYWQESSGFNGAWLVSRPGITLTIGSLAGILAFVLGGVMIRPATTRMAALSKEIQSSGLSPSPEQLAKLRAVQVQIARGGLYSAILLAIAVIGMSLAFYET